MPGGKQTALRSVPLWVGFALAAALSLFVFLYLDWTLNRRSDPVFASIQAIRAKPPERVEIVEVTPPPKPPPAPVPRLSNFLSPEIAANLVSVADHGDRSVITIKGDGFFEPGSTAIEARFTPLLVRIADALNSVPGRILVSGHTDNVPIRTARFPSNWHLSKARAESVSQRLSGGVDSRRVTVEGMADGEPLASNATPEGRARNRRVEITLFVESSSN